MARKQFYLDQPTAAGASTDSVPASNTLQVFSATACNPTGTDRTLDVHVMASGGSASASNQIYDALSVPQNSQVGLSLLINKIIPAGAVIHMVASADASITVSIDGDQS